MTQEEIIKEYAPLCMEDRQNGGILASVSLALIISGRMDRVDSRYIKTAHEGTRIRGKLLYPGIGKCETFEEAAKILGDEGTLLELNERWGLSRRFDGPTDRPVGKRFRVTSTRVRLYAGPGPEFARIDHCCKRGQVEITKEKNGYGKLKDCAGWVELKKCKPLQSAQ